MCQRPCSVDFYPHLAFQLSSKLEKNFVKKMAIIPVHARILSVCSLLMGLLFAYSASVQLNDPDWYLWFPLYGFASGVNLLHVGRQSKSFSQLSLLVSCGGMLLLLKVILEDCIHGVAGLSSLDMRERVVREKIGSGLVVLSMLLHLKASSSSSFSPTSQEGEKEHREQASKFAESGMVTLLAVSVGLTLYFFNSVQEHMKF